VPTIREVATSCGASAVVEEAFMLGVVHSVWMNRHIDRSSCR
jgi:hypothetical protein